MPQFSPLDEDTFGALGYIYIETSTAIDRHFRTEGSVILACGNKPEYLIAVGILSIIDIRLSFSLAGSNEGMEKLTSSVRE